MGGMIPLGDATRRPEHFPGVTVGIITVNALVFVAELSGGEAFVMRWSETPATITAGHHWITILTAMFMHAGWMHIIGTWYSFGPLAPKSRMPWGRCGIWRFTC